jgi:hypothetical protein
MTLAGTILQIMAWLVFIGGVAAGGMVLLPPARDFVTALTLIVSACFLGASLMSLMTSTN